MCFTDIFVQKVSGEKKEENGTNDRAKEQFENMREK
jgi:hypothetical protein